MRVVFTVRTIFLCSSRNWWIFTIMVLYQSPSVNLHFAICASESQCMDELAALVQIGNQYSLNIKTHALFFCSRLHPNGREFLTTAEKNAFPSLASHIHAVCDEWLNCVSYFASWRRQATARCFQIKYVCRRSAEIWDEKLVSAVFIVVFLLPLALRRQSFDSSMSVACFRFGYNWIGILSISWLVALSNKNIIPVNSTDRDGDRERAGDARIENR